MNRRLRQTMILGLMATTSALAACSGGGGGGGGPGPPPPPPARLEDGFGAGFAAAFRTNLNGVPRDPAAGDIIAVSLTTDPTPIP